MRKFCALVASATLLPALPAAWAHSDRQDINDRLWGDWGHANRWDDHNRDDANRWGDHDMDRGIGDRDRDPGRPPIPSVPDVANTAWLLLPVFGAVLVFSARQYFRSKA
jgi:hypothetical protein